LLLLSAFVGLNAINLTCKLEKLQYPGGSTNGCKVSNLRVTQRDQTITTVNNLKTSRPNCKMIEITSQTLNFIPQGFNTFFPSVEVLKITGSNLKEVQKKDLSQFPKLKRLILERNELEVLHGDLFDGNKALLHINFDGNNLTHVGSNLLKPVKKLEQALFQKSGCLNFTAGSNKMKTLETQIKVPQ
jgi:hypothetical protein